MKLMQELDLAYLAGFFDGEGCLSINKKHLVKGCTYGLAVSVTNTNQEILLWIRESTGMGKVTAKPRNRKWKLCYQWTLIVDEMKPFLLTIRPYLRVKKDRANLLLEFLETTKYHGPHHPLSEDEIIKREIIFLEMEEHNKRGSG